MSNRFLRMVCAAWLGASLAACGSMQEGEAPVETGEDAGIQAALARVQGARVLGSDEGIPYAVHGQFGRVSGPRGTLRSAPDVSEALSRVAPVFRLDASELVFRRASVDEQGHQHLRFQQTKNGLRVVGGELVVHVDEAGNVYAANGSARDGSRVSAAARLAPEAALKAAVEGSSARGAAARGSAELVYVRTEGSPEPRLAYEVRVEGERDGMPADDLVYVDAQRGGILLVNPLIHTALNRKVHSANNGQSTPGTLMRGEGHAPTRDAHVDTNYDMLGATYHCYQTLFGRDSYDNAGAPLSSTVHYGSNYVNAYWDGTQMVYGDGDGVRALELGRDLDVTVHELTHAVTSKESGLYYVGESGGLNESLSDIFAGVCESWTRNWAVDAEVFMIGEDIWTPGLANDALRYLDDPSRDGVSLDFYGDYAAGVDVHHSSGISNLVFALLSKGGAHPRGKTAHVVPAIGPEKAGRIFYKASTDLFTSVTDFARARTYTLQAAEALYGAGSAEVSAVNEAWKAVGVPNPPRVATPLSSGVPMRHLVGSFGHMRYFALEVPAGAEGLSFELSGGVGDADMYVRHGAMPSTRVYDCRPYKSGNAEVCSFTHPAAGTWYVMLHAAFIYSGVTLEGTYRGGRGGGTGTPVTETVSGGVVRGNETDVFGPYDVMAGTPFKVVMTGTRNPNLYVRFGAVPTFSTYACRPSMIGAQETCELTVPAGEHRAYLLVAGASSSISTYGLTLDYTKP